jgi:type VI secretion system VgrG family protein
MAGANLNSEQEKLFRFTVGGLDPGMFVVVDIKGVEEISHTYWFQLQVLCEATDLNLQYFIRKSATFEIVRTGQTAVYHCVITQMRIVSQIGDSGLYAVRLEPRVTALSYYQMSEVYLDKTLGGIIADVFKSGGLDVEDYELRLTENPATRTYPYLCQYEESSLNFLQWLMEVAGVYYYFEDNETSEKVVFLNAQISQSTAVRQVSYHPISGMDDDRTLADAVQRFTCATAALPRTLMVRNYDYRRASVKIEYEATVSGTGTGRVVIFGEPVGTVTEAQQVAEIRAQELNCRGTVYGGSSTAVGIRAGIGLQLQGYFRRDLNAKYLITQVRHEGSQAGLLLAGFGERQNGGRTESAVFYRNEFTALPWAVQYRPRRVTPKPRIAGTMSAFVDGEGSGKYAELDQYGRYKVQVPYDLTEKNAMRGSDWLRFATPHAGPPAGPDYPPVGMHFPLRKGTEVLLSYESGDPCRPLIVGVVVNSQYNNVVTRDNETYDIAQSSGGNLLQIQDQENNQHVLLGSPNSNSFVALGDTAGASQVKTALAAGAGHAASTAGAITQYTERDHLIKVRKGLGVEAGPNAVTRAALPAGDVEMTTDQNLVQNVGGYVQLNVGNPGVAAIPVRGDLQINTSRNVVITAAKSYNVNGTKYTINAKGDRTETLTSYWTDYYDNCTQQYWVQNEVVKGIQTTYNMGLINQYGVDLYGRLFGAIRLTVFATKNDFCWSRIERILVWKFEWAALYQLKLVSGTEVETDVVNINNQLTEVKTSATDIHNMATRLYNALTPIRSVAVMDGAQGFVILRT